MSKLLKAMCVISVLLFLFPQSAFANGGTGEGYALLSGGNIKFENTPDIFVEKENLHIVLYPRTSTVTAQYTLKNTGAARELSYIFPVTQYVSVEYEEGYVEWISFCDGEKSLNYTMIEEQIPEKEDELDGKYPHYSDKTTSFGDEEIYYNYIKNDYYKTNLSFAAGETKVLTVSYKASNSFDSWFSTSLLSTFSNVRFLYDLSPAATWGNGKAGEFNLSIDYRDLSLATGLAINMDGFSRDTSGVYNYSAKDFDFANEGLISAVFYYPFELEELKDYQKDSDWLSKIYVSSTLKSQTDAYSALNLFDGNPDTVWASDGKGEGETIELLFDRGLSSFGILNGFIKNEALYYDNARIKTLKVEAWSFDSTTDELMSGEYEVAFDDIPYANIDKSNLFNCLTLFDPHDSPWDLVRLTVTEVYPGRKYNDLCISEIFLFSQFVPDEYREEGFTLSPISICENSSEIGKGINSASPTGDGNMSSQPISSSAASQPKVPSDTGTPAAPDSPADAEPSSSAQPETPPSTAKNVIPIGIAFVLTFCAVIVIYIKMRKHPE